MRLSWSVLLAATVPATATFAREPSAFTICDGFGPSHGGSDGLNAPMSNPFAGNDPRPMAERINICTSAIGSAELAPNNWARRISLLEARAIMRLLINAPTDAASDIEVASSLGKTREADAHYKRSSALGIEMLRAVLDAQSGALASVHKRWAAISAARPYDLAVQSAAFRYLRATNAPLPILEPVIKRVVRLSPDGRDAAVDGLLNLGYAKEALSIALETPAQLEPNEITLSPEGENPLIQLANQLSATERLARLAFAAAIVGDMDTSSKLMTSAQFFGRKLTDLTPTKGNIANQLAAYQLTKDRVAQQTQQSVQRWSSLIDAHRKLANHQPVDLAAILELPTFAPEEADVLAAAIASGKSKPGNPDASGRLDLIRVRLREYAKQHLDPALIFSQLPPAELTENMPSFKFAGRGLFASGDGFKTEPAPNGETDVTFTSYIPSGQLVQELALYGAARASQAAGKQGFIIRRIRDYGFMNRITHERVDYNCEVRVQFVDLLSDPRAISAADVIAEMAPLFPPKS